MRRHLVAVVLAALAAGSVAYASSMTLTSDQLTVVSQSTVVDTIPTTTSTSTTSTTIPAATTLYLKTSAQPPANVTSSAELPLSTTAPSQATLFNYDTNRDSHPGLLVQKGQSQTWIVPGPFDVERGSFVFWSQMKDGTNSKKGSVRAILRACNAQGNGCATMRTTTLTTTGAWHGTNGVWVQKTISFGSFDGHNLENAERRLVLELSVLSDSGDDMWFAYDTTTLPSRLVLE